MYHLLVRPRAEKNFAKLPQKAKQRILQNLQKLQENPFDKTLDIKKLVGTKRSFRLRVGELRMLYEMDTKTREIFVTNIDFRRTTTY